MNAIIQGLNTYAGLFSVLVVVISAFFASKYMAKSNASDATNKAQNDAIKAMEEEIKSIRRTMEDLAKDNTKLKRTIETIRMALARRGITITISEDAIDIEDNKRSTTIRIQEKEE